MVLENVAKEQTAIARAQRLLNYHESMAVALRKMESGSTVEYGYFLEKLKNSANLLGYDLIKQE